MYPCCSIDLREAFLQSFSLKRLNSIGWSNINKLSSKVSLVIQSSNPSSPVIRHNHTMKVIKYPASVGQTITAEYVLFLQVMIFHQLQLMTLNAQQIISP